MRQPEIDVYVRTLGRAAVLSGGRYELAKKLQVTPEQIDAWINGAEDTPDAIFLRAVDLLMEDTLRSLGSRL